MADPLAGLRRVQIDGRLFGGYYTYVSLNNFTCTCEIVDHVRAILLSQLSELNLGKLVKKLMKMDLKIHEDLEELRKEKESEVVSICGYCKDEDNKDEDNKNEDDEDEQIQKVLSESNGGKESEVGGKGKEDEKSKEDRKGEVGGKGEREA